MKILWIVNTIFPEVCEKLKIEKTVYGGWLYATADAITKNKDVELIVATVHDGQYNSYEINEKKYLLLPRDDDKIIKQHWAKIKDEYNPELVHIHGTEYSHGLLYVKQNGSENVVFSIQGLVQVYTRYYIAGLSFTDILLNITLRDIIKFDTIYQQRSKFRRNGAREIEYFQLCKNVIGRTDWDNAHALNYNKNIKYYHCDEILRNSFYTSRKWDINACDRHTIFVSQASYPIKGLHKLLDAIHILVSEFPEIRLRIAGSNITKSNTILEKLKLSNYAKYLKRKIKHLQLNNHITFLGNLQEDDMINEYLNANIFICPSSVENSPNSVGEAQLIGVPVIASYVGGVPNMVTHEHDGLLYRFEEVEMLAQLIKKLFINKELCEILSHNAIKSANTRHNREFIYNELLKIYYHLKK